MGCGIIIDTKKVTGITTTAAASGGYNIISKDPIIDKGIVFSLDPLPTITSGTKISSGNGRLSYETDITGLYPGSTYYVRAYATNKQGTAYGDQKTFSALAVGLGEGCFYSYTVIPPNGSFILPPGAEVVSATGSAALVSSCGLTIPQEDLKCYYIEWVLNHDANSFHLRTILGGAIPVVMPETNNAWEDDTDPINIARIKIGDVINEMNVEARALTGLEAALTSSPNGAILSERKYYSHFQEDILTSLEQLTWTHLHSGYDIYRIYFKATEGIGKNTYMEFESETGNIGTIPRYFATEIDCAEYPEENNIEI